MCQNVFKNIQFIPYFLSTRPIIGIIWLSLVRQICVNLAWENPPCPLTKGAVTMEFWESRYAFIHRPSEQETKLDLVFFRTRPHFFSSASFKDERGGETASNQHCYLLLNAVNLSHQKEDGQLSSKILQIFGLLIEWKHVAYQKSTFTNNSSPLLWASKAPAPPPHSKHCMCYFI